MSRPLIPVIGILFFVAGLCLQAMFGVLPRYLFDSSPGRPGGMDVASALMILLGLGAIFPTVWQIPRAKALGWLELASYSIFVCGALLMAYMLIENQSFLIDMTARQYHTLSPQTREYLSRLDSTIEITAFHAPTADENYSKENIQNILDKYARLHPKISVNIYNPITQPLMAQAFTPPATSGDIYVQAAQEDKDSTGAVKSIKINDLTEESLTNGIVNAVHGESLTIFFLKAFQRKSYAFNSDDLTRLLQQYFFDRGIRCEWADLATNREVLREIGRSILFCVGPTQDLSAEELSQIRSYLDRGGKALFMIDGFFAPIALDNYQSLLRDYGILIKNTLLEAPELTEFYKNSLPYPTQVHWREDSHSLVKALPQQGTPSFMLLARPVRRDLLIPDHVSATEFLFTNPEVDTYELDAQTLQLRQNAELARIQGQPAIYPVAVAAEKRLAGMGEEEASKLIVIGNSALFTDYKTWNPFQEILFSNMVNWLSATDSRIAIPQKRPALPPIFLNEEKIRALHTLLIIMLPFTIFFGGIGYTISRKRLG